MEKLLNTELHALYSSPDIIRNIKSRRLRWAGHVARMGESRNAYTVLVGRPEGKRPLGRPRSRWEDNIKMDLREVGYDDREWINFTQDRDQWRAYVRDGNEPPGSLKANKANLKEKVTGAAQSTKALACRSGVALGSGSSTGSSSSSTDSGSSGSSSSSSSTDSGSNNSSSSTSNSSNTSSTGGSSNSSSTGGSSNSSSSAVAAGTISSSSSVGGGGGGGGGGGVVLAVVVVVVVVVVVAVAAKTKLNKY
ncbi:hypothetical protein ANN_07634 [Periplaneta americana]|uniref:Uncharacterized protein n=1 Tax=Periplaneta americana TaxID=6978 RepID=A0ABQ8SZ74_PERAM|nr:hypothetical protein ANN_07634 [Periplaneta americana]